MMIFKKIGFVFVYYFLASLIDQIFLMLCGNIYVSFVLTVLCICLTSCELRNAQILGRNYIQEQRDEYSKNFSAKFKRIVCCLDFMVEVVLGIIVCLFFMLIPRVAMGACNAFYIISINRLFALVFIPLFVVIDFCIWYFAYYKSFKKKKY